LSGWHEQLRIVGCPAVAFVDSDGHHHSGVLVGFANCVDRSGWHGYGLVKQFKMFVADSDFVRCLDEGKIGIASPGRWAALPICAAASALLFAPLRRLGCRRGILMMLQFYRRFDMFGELHGTIAIGGETCE
jgi:hypothetical protein